MQAPSTTAAGSRSSDCTLVIMAKAPKPGVVKTRLAQSLPLADVVELYRCLLDDTMALAQSLEDVQVAIMCPASDVEDLSRAVGDAIPVVAQSGDGLAAGLTSVFAHFAAAGHRRVVAFNSDSPHLPASVLKSAFRALARVTSLLVRRTTEVITSSARARLIRDFSRATGSGPRMHTRRYLCGCGGWDFR